MLQPLQVMDPDHPLAELVRKARLAKNGAAAMATNQAEASAEAAVATMAPAQPDYCADREYTSSFHCS